MGKMTKSQLFSLFFKIIFECNQCPLSDSEQINIKHDLHTNKTYHNCVNNIIPPIPQKSVEFSHMELEQPVCLAEGTTI